MPVILHKLQKGGGEKGFFFIVAVLCSHCLMFYFHMAARVTATFYDAKGYQQVNFLAL